MNQITILGRMTRDPELRHTTSGTPVTAFSVAVDRPPTKSGEKGVDFIEAVAWRSTGENICKYFRKGHRILLNGRLQIRDWTDGDGHKRRNAEVFVNNFEFIELRSDTAPKGDSAPAYDGYNTPVSGSPFGDLEEDDGDDLPF